MTTAADKKRWDKLHADLEKADTERDDLEIALRVKYGGDVTRPGNRHWMSRAERTKFEKAGDRVEKIHDQIYELVTRISPRDWSHGAPGHWVTRKLTWEDAIRPTNEPLSVVVPGSYGYPDGYVKEQRSTKTMKIKIPDMKMWQQIGGDMNPGAHGGLIARTDGDALELLEIQPVREFVGDGDAADVGFPFWTKEAYFTLDDLDPSNKYVQSALESIDMDMRTLEEDFSPTQRALMIAEALVMYGRADEGTGGWSADIIHDKVKWSSGEIAGAEYLADEDEDFRRDILGEEDEDEDEEDGEDEYEEEE